jgi:transposase InsO family protein
VAARPRRPRVRELIHQSDRGSQYLSVRYTDRLDAAGALSSVGSKGDSFDNAAAESLIGLYKTELIRRRGPLRQPITPPVLAIGPRRFLDPGPGSTASWLHGDVLRGRDLRNRRNPSPDTARCPAPWPAARWCNPRPGTAGRTADALPTVPAAAASPPVARPAATPPR